MIKESEKLRNKIKKSIEKGKIIEKEWNQNDNNLSSLINDCINIENNIKEINLINDSIKKSQLNKGCIIFYNIKELEINQLKNTIQNFGEIMTEDKLYRDFKIEAKNPVHTLKNHTASVYCLCVLSDGRLASGSADKSIIIYNKETFQPDLIIKEHNNTITCITQLSSGLTASCSCDKTIKLFDIQEKKYKIVQTLNYHNNEVYKIIELKNKNLVSCSGDSSIIFYIKDNNEYKKYDQIKTDGSCTTVIQTKDNEICYSEKNNDKICFYNFLEKRIKSSISNISKNDGKNHGVREWFVMIKKNLLLIPGNSQITIINTEQYKLVQKIDIGSNWICGVCMINQDMLLTGGDDHLMMQWKIEGDNIKLISKKENTHNGDISVLLNIGRGFIASGACDNTVKIW